jgi:hypothetical protein
LWALSVVSDEEGPFCSIAERAEGT